jgi:hypothetical protein
LEPRVHHSYVLRITTTAADKVLMKLEGRLVGPWVDVLRKDVFQTGAWARPLAVDVSDLTFADEDGESALSWLHRMGARFQGKGSFSEYLFERLNIPLFSREAKFDEGDGRKSR